MIDAKLTACLHRALYPQWRLGLLRLHEWAYLSDVAATLLKLRSELTSFKRPRILADT